MPTRTRVPRLAVIAALLALGCSQKPDAAAVRRAEANVRYGLFGDRISGIDPLSMGRAGAVGVDIFETLYQYHDLERPYALIPLLADGMPRVSDDGMTYVIRIRSDARFSDDPAFAGGVGRPPVAADFVHALARIADAPTRRPRGVRCAIGSSGWMTSARHRWHRWHRCHRCHRSHSHMTYRSRA